LLAIKTLPISTLSAARSGAMLAFHVVFVKENDSEFLLGTSLDNSKSFRYKDNALSNDEVCPALKEEAPWSQIPRTTCPESLPTFFMTMLPPR
jgi:hypothetical protein